MKKLIVVSVIMVGMLMGGFLAPLNAQSPGGDLKPTFLSPTPGLYVNGWPVFTVSYPKDWVVQSNVAAEVYRVGVPGQAAPPPVPALMIAASANATDISGSANALVGFTTMLGFKEIKVLSDKPAKLQDGTPAQETEIELIPPFPNAKKRNWFVLTTKKDGAWIQVTVVDEKGMIRDELKRIAYTLKVAQGTQEAVKLPPDVQAFIDKWNSDIDSHDVARIMSNYSDQFQYNGFNKAFFEGWYRNAPDSPVQLGVTLGDDNGHDF